MEKTKEATKKKTTAKTTTKKTNAKTPTTKKSTSTPKTVEKKEEVKVENKKVTYEVDAFAAISFILGVASLITWLYPILGVAIAIPGLAIGIVTHETRRSNYSLLGIVMSLVGIILSILKVFTM